MTQAAPKAIAVAKILDQVMRSDRGRLLAALVANLRNISLAEEALQDAAISALSHWGRLGMPNSPQGWLLTVARRKALDKLRGNKSEMQKAHDLSLVISREEEEQQEIPDERLRLIFACCHPALELKSRVALTLRTVCGLTTIEIAKVFLDQETTMGQRLSRAKTKISAAGIRFEVPAIEHWPARLHAVLTTIYLIFTTGYLADGSEERDFCKEAEFLMRLINQLQPDDPEIQGALAMILLTSARRGARIGEDGASVAPADQDQNLWDQQKISEGRAILAKAVSSRAPGAFQIKAAIADCQMFKTGPDWRQIALLYQSLLRFEPTPIVSLNAAVAVAEAGDPAKALSLIEELSEHLSQYQPWHASRAAILAKTGNHTQAIAAYKTAIDIAPSIADKLFLEKRVALVKMWWAVQS